MDRRLDRLRDLIEQSANRMGRRDMAGMDCSGLYAWYDEILIRIGEQIMRHSSQGLFSNEILELVDAMKDHGFAESGLLRVICFQLSSRVMPYENTRSEVKLRYGISNAAKEALHEEHLCKIRDEMAERIEAVAIALGLVEEERVIDFKLTEKQRDFLQAAFECNARNGVFVSSSDVDTRNLGRGGSSSRRIREALVKMGMLNANTQGVSVTAKGERAMKIASPTHARMPVSQP
ncbi:MAG: hypothetical protein KDB00_30345 [Planctomycetales bacterium]|nr:hypothetical protein [Planctomycetales bacterium]